MRADRWRIIGAAEDEVRSIRFVILDLPSIPFTSGVVLPEIPQTEEVLLFGREELRAGCASEIYEDIGVEEAREALSMRLMVSSAFVVWYGEGVERKKLFVINLSQQSQHWPKGSVKMENLPCFALNLAKNDHLMSWDVKSGYRHFYLHPKMRDYFLFQYGDRSYRCIALPFGWERSVYGSRS
jgi:hypothetical protein